MTTLDELRVSVAKFEETHEGDPAVRMLVRRLIGEVEHSEKVVAVVKELGAAVGLLADGVEKLERRIAELER